MKRGRDRPDRSYWRWLPALGWAAGMWWLSATPGDEGSWLSLAIADLPLLDKVAHAGLFGVLAALLRFARVTPLAAVALASAWGAVDEVHQAFVPGRTADPWDLVADVTGAILAVLAVRWLAARRQAARYSGRPERRSEP